MAKLKGREDGKDNQSLTDQTRNTTEMNSQDMNGKTRDRDDWGKVVNSNESSGH